MTYPEFLTALRELVKSGEVKFYVNECDQIRDMEARCPVCSVGRHKFGLQYYGDVHSAGEFMGLRLADRIQIANAADVPSHHFRNELERLCGLGGDA